MLGSLPRSRQCSVFVTWSRGVHRCCASRHAPLARPSPSLSELLRSLVFERFLQLQRRICLGGGRSGFQSAIDWPSLVIDSETRRSSPEGGTGARQFSYYPMGLLADFLTTSLGIPLHASGNPTSLAVLGGANPEKSPTYVYLRLDGTHPGRTKQLAHRKTLFFFSFFFFRVGAKRKNWVF
jgi:hypothetical protein